VRLLDQGAVQQEGLAAGVDDQGRLLLDTPSGRVAVLSGDVSLRLAQ
jgi:BirA family biotin operon repressor/biotin-[acetyl-CoA-carboxylase] ligase